MANETLTFACPACGTKLTFPVGLAGVVGPCPSCNTQIQAPHPNPVPAVAHVPATVPEVPVNVPRSPSEPPPVPAAASTTPSAVKPEPRQLPNRPHPPAVVAKQMPEPNRIGDDLQPKAAPLGKHPHAPGLLARFTMFLLFLVASGALVFGILTVLRPQTEKADRSQHAAAHPESPPMAEAIPALSAHESSEIQALPTPLPEPTSLMVDTPRQAEGAPPKAPGIQALEVLEKFLTAKSLSERLPMIETKTPIDELAMSCLAGPLPPAPKMLLEFQETNPIENVVDFYYSVDFEDVSQSANPQTLLVRTRSGSDPKVVVDPFLDLYGGRLASYAASPISQTGEFQVIASALATCTNPQVPDRQKKLTLKLLARENAKEIADAYFGKLSDIGQMLEDGTYSLSYGKAKACTVVLRWNSEDDENHPYLEAVAIKTLDWNP